MSTYRIVRLHKDNNRRPVLVQRCTLEEAQLWCRNPETSSSTCEGETGKKYTEVHGPWFDAYEEVRG